jgi:hypothetical protein
MTNLVRKITNFADRYVFTVFTHYACHGFNHSFS